MQTVIMVIAVIKKGDHVLLRKMDPARNPYKEPWGLFGGRLEGKGGINEQMNRELQARWNMTVAVIERLWWDEEQKMDHDSEEKKFIYLDALCELSSGTPQPVNSKEELEWVNIDSLESYVLNPPSATLLKKLGYLKNV